MIITDTTLEDVPGLQVIYDALAYMGSWSGPTDDDKVEQPILLHFEYGNLPPGGHRDRGRMQSLRLKNTGDLIGYLELYHGYPVPAIAWIGVFAIAPAFQQNGYGQEVIHRLSDALQACGYHSIRLLVAVKNWPGLRFWIKTGFTHIIGFQGDRVYSDNSFAELNLEKIL